MLAADSGEALGYFLVDLTDFFLSSGILALNHHGESCFLLYFAQSECCACRLPKPCCLTPHSNIDWSEFRLSRLDSSAVLAIACSATTGGTDVARVGARDNLA